MGRKRNDVESDQSKSTKRKENKGRMCSLIDPNDINWLNVDRNTWFICLNFTTNKGYYFPICEEENRENNYGRVKQGMKYFISKGWEAYKIQ